MTSTCSATTPTQRRHADRHRRDRGIGDGGDHAVGTLIYGRARLRGHDTIRYTIADGQGGTADAFVRVTVDPLNDAPVAPAPGEPVEAVGGLPVVIDGLAGASDIDGDRLTIVDATAGQGTVAISPDGRLIYAPPLSFIGTTTITYTFRRQRRHRHRTILVRVADGRGATSSSCSASAASPSRIRPRRSPRGHARRHGRNPLSRSASRSTASARLRGTASATSRSATRWKASAPARHLDRSRRADPRGRGRPARRASATTATRATGCSTQRWGDFMVKGLTGFSAAADRHACIMVESVVRGGAIYLEVRDIATRGRARAGPQRRRAPRRPASAAPDWITRRPPRPRDHRARRGHGRAPPRRPRHPHRRLPSRPPRSSSRARPARSSSTGN